MHRVKRNFNEIIPLSSNRKFKKRKVELPEKLTEEKINEEELKEYLRLHQIYGHLNADPISEVVQKMLYI
jgi:hypothetical protein